MFAPLAHRLQEIGLLAGTAPISRRSLHMTTASLLGGLPALGNVLYVPMRPCGSPTWEMPRDLLVESLQLAPLLQTRGVMAASMISVEGPREWIDCVGRNGRLCARLHLLPDTDYFAWDALLACGEPATAATPECWPSHHGASSAQLLCFHLRWLAGMQILGVEAATQLSSLGRQLAGQIARAEAVPLQLAASG